jgi:hypothetical protein
MVGLGLEGLSDVDARSIQVACPRWSSRSSVACESWGGEEQERSGLGTQLHVGLGTAVKSSDVRGTQLPGAGQQG